MRPVSAGRGTRSASTATMTAPTSASSTLCRFQLLACGTGRPRLGRHDRNDEQQDAGPRRERAIKIRKNPEVWRWRQSLRRRPRRERAQKSSSPARERLRAFARDSCSGLRFRLRSGSCLPLGLFASAFASARALAFALRSRGCGRLLLRGRLACDRAWREAAVRRRRGAWGGGGGARRTARGGGGGGRLRLRGGLRRRRWRRTQAVVGEPARDPATARRAQAPSA